MKMLKLIGGSLLILAAVIVVRTIMHSPPPRADVTLVNLNIDAKKAAQHLSESITFKTVSNQSQADKNDAEFTGFIQWVKDTYPSVNSKRIGKSK